MAIESQPRVFEASGGVWSQLRVEAAQAAAEEPLLASYLHASILHHDRLEDALSYHLAQKLGHGDLPALQLREVIRDAYADDPQLAVQAARDMRVVRERDPACRTYLQPFLFFKGYGGLQSYRIAHWLWTQERHILAYHLQSRVSELFAVDIHPNAKIGAGVFIDHAHGIVIGETAVVDDDVSMLHSVTLGGTGKEGGDRHPKIRRGVMIGAGAKVLGNIVVGEDARIAAGSVVLHDVAPRCTVAGVPAKPVGGPCCGGAAPAETMDQSLDEDYSI
ncbi:MAG: serine O-acetyltransferase [Hyphomonadaceae bacterium]|nr:serine O-acetyltransferase [Hyphomonadaceae bacterium]GIK49406.1 MAG: serine O-acetyltransferase [Alphaproteobacteria bacterium]